MVSSFKIICLIIQPLLIKLFRNVTLLRNELVLLVFFNPRKLMMNKSGEKRTFDDTLSNWSRISLVLFSIIAIY